MLQLAESAPMPIPTYSLHTLVESAIFLHALQKNRQMLQPIPSENMCDDKMINKKIPYTPRERKNTSLERISTHFCIRHTLLYS